MTDSVMEECTRWYVEEEVYRVVHTVVVHREEEYSAQSYPSSLGEE